MSEALKTVGISDLRDRLPIDPTSLIDFALELYSEQGIEFDAAEVAQQVRDFFHGRDLRFD